MPAFVRLLTALLLSISVPAAMAANAPIPPPPKPDAKSWILIDEQSGRVITSHNADARVDAYVVESENFESIHNHSAYALIEKDKLRGAASR